VVLLALLSPTGWPALQSLCSQERKQRPLMSAPLDTTLRDPLPASRHPGEHCDHSTGLKTWSANDLDQWVQKHLLAQYKYTHLTLAPDCWYLMTVRDSEH
tara:strand:+ start:4185 stop:4484 length:300 start_codon:yes stop_codon:yes gene_type:complete